MGYSAPVSLLCLMKNAFLYFCLLGLSACGFTKPNYKKMVIGTWINEPFNGIRITADSIYSAEDFECKRYIVKGDSILIFSPERQISQRLFFFGRDTFYMGQPFDSTNPVFVRVKR